MPTLHEALWNLTLDELRRRLKFLLPGSKATRKAELVDGIKAALDGQALPVALRALDKTGLLAVSEAIYDPENRHRPVVFRSKHGCDAGFLLKDSRGSEFSSGHQSPQDSTRLNVFFYPEGSRESPLVPSDLAARLRTLLPKPSAAGIQSVPEPETDGGLAVRHTESEALAELGALLRLASAGKLGFSEKTGVPARNSLPAILASLAGGDWFAPEVAFIDNRKSWQREIGAIKPIGWTRLLHAAGLITMKGSKSALTPQGRQAVEKPAWEVIGEVWRRWISNKQYDEFNRIDVIKGQSARGSLTARGPRRSMMLEALGNCPAGEWFSHDAFSHYMRAAGLMFEVSPDPWKLYIGDSHYGALGYSGYGGWEVLQDRYMLCVLMEYAATLGLIDIAYKVPEDARPVDQWGMDEYSWLSRYDGLQAFRINPLGAYVLGGGKSAFKPSRPGTQARLTVLGNRTIRVASGKLSSTERIQLENWAQPEGDEVFRLDETLALDAVESGQDPDNFARFLEERDDQPLPESAIAFLRQARENGQAMRQSGSAHLFECRDARTAKTVSANKDLARLCLLAGGTTLVVREEDLAKFRRHVRTLGLGIR